MSGGPLLGKANGGLNVAGREQLPLGRVWVRERVRERERGEETSALINLSRKSRRVMWPGREKSSSFKKSICQVSRHVQLNERREGAEEVAFQDFSLRIRAAGSWNGGEM